MYKFTALLISVLLIGFSVTQAQDIYSPRPNVVITGDEVGEPNPNVDVIQGSTISFGNFYGRSFTWGVHNITDRKTGYDLQSNASTEQVWLDLNNPDYIHAVFTNSQVDDNAWADRTCLYFGSTDAGANWFELGGVPVNTGTSGRSGFPAIVGNSQGSAIIANHNNSEGTSTHTKIFIDNSPFEYNFTTYNPPVWNPQNQGDLIWPRLAISSSDDIVYASSINGGDSMYTNTLSSAGVFGNLQVLNGDQAETHSLAFSESGAKVGLVIVGGLGEDYSVSYYESTDNGATWGTPVTVWTPFTDPITGDIKGCIRGVYLTFYGEEPCVVFETGWNTLTGYYPGLESEIRFWSPNINGGNSKIIADSNNVAYYPNYGVADVQYPIGRPVISHAQEPYNNYLFVAFDATSGNYWPGAGSTDSTAYMRGMFMWSEDGGETWGTPEQFTPDTPLLDWRYPSLVPVCPVTSNPGSNDIITVHMVMQGDTIPGSTVNGWNIMPPSVTAQYYHFSTEIEIVSNNDEIIANDFSLDQNYPNPFNPNTTINYSLGERSQVTLKVYDVLGSEVATLVNTTQEAGKHNVTFDASKLSSGLYIYTINAGNFTSSKKMMLLK
jgi:hypothetical protein